MGKHQAQITEALKRDLDEANNIFHSLFEKIWEVKILIIGQKA